MSDTTLSQEEMQARIESLSEQIKAQTNELAQLRLRLAESQTTLKIGDRVTYQGAKYVWELTKIKPGYAFLNGPGTPRFEGKKIRKDGTPGMLEGEIYTGRFELTLVDSGEMEDSK